MSRLSSAFCAVSLFYVTSAQCPFSKPVTDMSQDELDACPHALKSTIKPPKTVKGCTCKSECGATIDEDVYNCDWCRTTDGCGRSSLTGSWDFCDYPADQSYEGRPWNTKLDELYSAITADNKSGSYPSIPGIFTESVHPSFDNFADVMPPGRQKYIHSVGAVCKFSMAISSVSPFSGLLKAGSSVHGFVRLGSALAVDLKSGVTPGIGVKMIRSNVASGNFVALNSLSPLPDNSYNFFQEPLSNHIPAPDSMSAKLLVRKFTQASGCPTQVGLSDICKYDIDGKEVSDLSFPFKLVLTSEQMQFPSTPVSQEGLQSLLTSIKGNTPLYSVVAYTSPTSSIKLGTMMTEGDCVSSAFGDAHLFFRHQLIEEDWALKPEWMRSLDPKAECGGASSISSTPPRKCSTYDVQDAIWR